MPRGKTKTTRRVVDDCLQLAISAMAKGRCTLTWEQGGEKIASIDYEYTEECVAIPAQTITLRPVREIESHRFGVTFSTRKLRHEVRKWVFICCCGRRVAKLYLPANESAFRCRHCYNLTHRSAQTHLKDEYVLAKHPERIPAALSSSNPRTRLLGARALIRRALWEEGHCSRRVAKQIGLE